MSDRHGVSNGMEIKIELKILFSFEDFVMFIDSVLLHLIAIGFLILFSGIVNSEDGG